MLTFYSPICCSIRFLAFAVIECELFFDVLFEATHPETSCVEDLFGKLAEWGWVTEKTGHDLKKFMVDTVIPMYKEGMEMGCRVLDDHATFSELVKVTIVNVDVGNFGAYTIRFADGHLDYTKVWYLQPLGGVR